MMKEWYGTTSSLLYVCRHNYADNCVDIHSYYTIISLSVYKVLLHNCHVMCRMFNGTLKYSRALSIYVCI